MLLEFIRFFRGSVRFTINGKFPERFLNITAGRGVRLWNVRRGADFSACMYMADYRRIRPLARGAGVRLRVTQRFGFPSLLKRYRDRTGLLIGACAFLLTVFIMSQFIWSIDVVGTQTLSRTEVLALLRENGLYVGAFKPFVDDTAIAHEMMLSRPEIGWMAVNLTGSYASVEIKEETPPPEVKDIATPCNVKATRDGRVIRLNAYEGTTEIEEGSGVVAGQLIVSGVMGSPEVGERLVHADALVIAETVHEASFSVPDHLTGIRPNGEFAERRSAELFGLRLPYGFAGVSSERSVVLERKESPAPMDVTLPLASVSEKVYALEEFERSLDEKTAEGLLLQQSELYETFALCNCTVTNRSTRLTHNGGQYTLCVTYTCEEDIAESVPIGVTDNRQPATSDR